MAEIPLALHPPDPKIPIRLVRLSDSSSLRLNCWPERTFDSIYRFIMRARQNATQGRGLGVVVLGGGNQVRGYGQMTLWPRCGEISDLVVAEPYRSQGLGTAIIQYLTRSARDMHAECLDIGALESNAGAIALYRRLGFTDSYTQMMETANGSETVIYLRIKLNRK
jgi:ribosomal protein S18 acetylase RimI-like enzyme